MALPPLPPRPEPEPVPEMWKNLNEIRRPRFYPRGSRMFEHGAEAAGIYVVESGEVRIVLPTAQKTGQLLKVVGPGAILGLSESMAGDRHRVTAEADSDTTVGFISRSSFVAFLESHGAFCMQVVRLLSEDLHALYHKFRNVSSHPGRPRQRVAQEELN